jgi:hypothetical protein
MLALGRIFGLLLGVGTVSNEISVRTAITAAIRVCKARLVVVGTYDLNFGDDW